MSMRGAAFKHKHLKLDQKKIDFAKRYFGGRTANPCRHDAVEGKLESR
jgi:hypothetical protein